MKIPVLLISFLVASADFTRNEPIVFRIENDYDIVRYESDTIQRPEKLQSFFNRLEEVKAGKQKKVSILHIGDSHIQADWLTGRLRDHFQNEFGNAGRGLIFPARAGKSNESYTFQSTAKGNWEFKRIVFPEQPLPIGIAGMTLSTCDSAASIRIELRDYKGSLPYQKKITFFYEKDPLSYFAHLKDSIGQSTSFLGAYTQEEADDISTIHLNKPSRIFSIEVLKTQPVQERFTFYGLHLENGRPGVLYHSVGVNGAKVKHFLEAKHFFRQSMWLRPDLIIISLGTNEIQDFPNQDSQYEEHWKNLLSKLESSHPGIPILVTTPPGHFKNGTKKNPGMEVILNSILSIANQKSISVFNLFEAGGGKHFASQWSKKALLQSDGVHFTKEGYELQADMLYLAMINAYNNHVQH